MVAFLVKVRFRDLPKIEENLLVTYIDPIFLLFTVISIISFGWFAVNWLGKPGDEGDLAIKALTSLVIGLVGFFMGRLLVDARIIGIPKEVRWKILLTIIMGIIGAIGLQWIVIYSLTLGSVSDEVKMLFFLSIVPLEEMFFRFFVQNAGRRIIYLFGSRSPWILSIGGTMLSATTFMLFHWQVYGQKPEFLWSTFALGTVLAFSYDYTKFLGVPVAIHFFINLLATRGVIFFLPPP